MTDTLKTLADHGFAVLSPESPQKASTYDYERLFRTASETLADGFAEKASRETMVRTIAGEMSKTGRRIEARRNNNYDPSEGTLSDEATEFAEVFIDEIFYGTCDGDYYQLRRLTDRLASGFNLAMRERQQEFYDSLNEGTSSDADASDNGQTADTTGEN
jgi:CRISPR type I-D-associated protein Csc3/Cas10d